MTRKGLGQLALASAVAIVLAGLMGAAGDTRTAHVQKAQIEDAAGDVMNVNTDGSLNLSAVDPCQSPSVTKSSVVVTGTADAQLVAISGSTTVYVCGWSLNAAAGTGPGFRFIYGTGSVCGTGTTGLTGIYVMAVNGISEYGIGATALKTAAANALCLDVNGTSADIRGVVTYVQQ